MNPRLVEPGFVVVSLHADVPARPGKDEKRENDAEVARHHGKAGYLHWQAVRKARAHRAGESSTMPPEDRNFPGVLRGAARWRTQSSCSHAIDVCQPRAARPDASVPALLAVLLPCLNLLHNLIGVTHRIPGGEILEEGGRRRT